MMKTMQMQAPLILVVLGSLAACRGNKNSAEMVPSHLLDDEESTKKPAAPQKITSTSTGREDLPHYPPPPDALATATGLKYIFLAKGSGKEHPTGRSEVTVHYEGRTTDGQVFDSSLGGEPATLGLNQVIEGWREGVKLMREGDKVRLWIPEDLAYKGQPGTPQGLLIFDIELLKIAYTPPPGE
jgi:FKBP-type peptidyl-prolyl cis-trans isomerase